MTYSSKHQLYPSMQKLVKKANESPVTIKCESSAQAKYIQRVFHEFKRTVDPKSRELYEHLQTKRKGCVVKFISKAVVALNSADVINQALNIMPTARDKAEVTLSKALEINDQPSTSNGSQVTLAQQEFISRLEKSKEPSRKRVEAPWVTKGEGSVPPDPSKKPFTRHAGHFVKGDPRISKGGQPKGGVDPSDRIWGYLEKHRGEWFSEDVLRKAISFNKLSYNLLKFDTGLRWLAENGFVIIEGTIGRRRVRTS